MKKIEIKTYKMNPEITTPYDHECETVTGATGVDVNEVRHKLMTHLVETTCNCKDPDRDPDFKCNAQVPSIVAEIIEKSMTKRELAVFAAVLHIRECELEAFENKVSKVLTLKASLAQSGEA